MTFIQFAINSVYILLGITILIVILRSVFDDSLSQSEEYERDNPIFRKDGTIV